MGDKIMISTAKKSIHSRLLKLEGCPNFRDLGGYVCGDGATTRKNTFYRADCLSKLTEGDICTLEDLGITTVIDLRTQEELARAANPLRDREGFEYYNLSLSDGLQSEELKGLMPESLSKMYRALADEAGEVIETIFSILARAPGVAVFHCAAGKDRTGVIAALLLMLAGVSDDDIVSDYSCTYELMKPIFDNQISQAALVGIEVPKELMMSEPANMEEFLAHINNVRGGIVTYLEQIGLHSDKINTLRRKITEVA